MRVRVGDAPAAVRTGKVDDSVGGEIPKDQLDVRRNAEIKVHMRR